MKPLSVVLTFIFSVCFFSFYTVVVAQEAEYSKRAVPPHAAEAEKNIRDRSFIRTARAYSVPSPVSILLLSEPAGARIYINGVAMKSETPAKIQMPATSRPQVIRLEKEDCRPWEKTAFFMQGENVTMKANLKRSGGRIQFHTEPWTIVFIDGKVAGATPLFSEEIPEGAYKLRMVNEEFGIDTVESVNIMAGETKKIFKRFYGTLQIDLQANADTYLNGEFLEGTPPVIRQLPCGYHQVKRISQENSSETVLNILLKDSERKEIP